MGTTQKSIGTGMIFWALSAGSVSAVPSTTFTYQGQLKDGGIPAHGEYDMRFSFYNAAGGGALIAGPLAFDGGDGNGLPVFVANGLFQVELDFGAVFDGSALWLQVEVRPHSGGGFTLLSPRQALNATPVALYALDGPGGSGSWGTSGPNIHNTNTGNVGIGTTAPAAPLHVMGEVRSEGGNLLSASPNDDRSVAFLGWGTDADGNDMARIRIGGDGVGASNGLDIQKTGDRSLMRIYHSGDVWVRGGLETTRLTVVADEDSVPAISASGYWGVSGSASDAAGYGGVFGGSGFLGSGQALLSWGDSHFVGDVGIGTTAPAGKVHVTGGTESSPGGGGFLVLGETTAANISIDNNEILARNNGAVATLHLNSSGGDIVCGGPIDIGYQVVYVQFPTSPGQVVAQCPAGKRVLGGGCSCDDPAEDSHPINNNTAWYCHCHDGGVSGWAICARVK